MLAIISPMGVENTGIQGALLRVPNSGVTLHTSGIGRRRVRDTIARLAESPRPDALILAGFCGALDPDLHTGDIHVARSFRHPGQPESIAADKRLASVVADAAGSWLVATHADSVTVAEIAQPDAKEDLRQYGATVNMEDYWAAWAAAAAGIPFVAVRAVLDTADQWLPAYAAQAADQPGRIIIGTIRNPSRILELLRLNRQIVQARRSLTHCVLAALNELPEAAR